MKRRAIVIASSLLLSLCLHHQTLIAEEIDVNLEIDGLRNQNGSVNVAIYDHRDAFPSNDAKALRTLHLSIERSKATAKLRLPEGKYALAMFHDENSDGKFQKNFLGFPAEGFGFSKNPKVILRAPKFDDCAVTVGVNNKLITIRMQY